MPKFKIYRKREGKGYSKEFDEDGFRKDSYKAIGIKIGKKKFNREVEKSRHDENVRKKIKRVTYSKLVPTPGGSKTEATKVKIVKKGRGVKRTVDKY